MTLLAGVLGAWAVLPAAVLLTLAIAGTWVLDADVSAGTVQIHHGRTIPTVTSTVP